ncbi:amino acid ABC transporter permease [Lichenifustis flavocetrariae]|uniref:Amino acid ABC transporter permease n=1 Tax=Lichenifustis flavocetrariae TaxID=2949735 RepID=A0AA42CQ97_9HYPH|nr:amino acid ABC transporter permease [Lichenifustis flavocetrariae]MCW6511237.1 amino acid ABC transporter permease [Lichenifustis flavocetrariae]
MLYQLGLILRGLPWTILITAVSLLIGCILGYPIMLGRNARSLPVRLVSIAFISLIRAVPPLVWLFIIFFGVGTGAFSMSPLTAALIGLGLIAATNMAEIYRGGLISIHHGQWEAAQALNLGGAHTFRDVIAPQMFRVALPSSATYAIGLMKDTAIASTIGVPELAYQGARLTQETFQGLKVFGMVGLIYILLSLPIAWLSRRADLYLRAKVAR